MSSLSLGDRSAHKLREDSIIVEPDGCIVFIQFYFDGLVMIYFLCLFCSRNFNVLLTVHPDTIKVLFANLMHNLFIKSIIFLYMFSALFCSLSGELNCMSSLNLCAEQSPKESDDIRNQMMHTYN